VGWLSAAFTARVARRAHKVCPAEERWKGLFGYRQCFMFPDFTPPTLSKKHSAGSTLASCPALWGLLQSVPPRQGRREGCAFPLCALHGAHPYATEASAEKDIT